MNCKDCEKELVKGEEFVKYEKTNQIKCKDCFEKNPVMEDYQACDVYSRVVGYMSPTYRWNSGKSEEFKDRVTFKNGLETNKTPKAAKL